MSRHIAIVGAGITGITTAYALQQRGYDVTILERHRYDAMETSFANGGQLSACNAEVWNNWATVFKGLRWLFRSDAPLLLNLKPSWHKYSWLGEFLGHIRHYRANTVQTVRLAIEARKYLLDAAEREGIAFDHERRGMLHIYHDKAGFDAGLAANKLLREGGLDRDPVTPEEIGSIEPSITRTYYGGFFTPSDATGDIQKFTRGLAEACVPDGGEIRIVWSSAADEVTRVSQTLRADGIVICAGVASRQLATMLGDRINVYPVKGYSVTVNLDEEGSRVAAPTVGLLDDAVKIVTSRLGADRLRVAGTAEFNGFNRDIRADRIQPLVDWVRHNFPAVATSSVVPWAGLRPMMPNMMPVVRPGRRPGVFYNTGHGHLGWTLSAATAQIVGEAIEKRGWS